MKKQSKAESLKSRNHRLDIYQSVTDRIIELMKRGTPPWRKTWGNYGLARNFVSNRPYRGINALLLNTTSFRFPLFLTFKQIEKLGGKVLKGSKAEYVYFFSFFFKDVNGKSITEEQYITHRSEGAKRLAILKRYPVFNIEQATGIAFSGFELEQEQNNSISACESVLELMSNPPLIRASKDGGCCYIPASDTIYMMPMLVFNSSEEFYCTLYHELIHATGHESRMARVENYIYPVFGSFEYSKEELVAEIGAAMLCGITGIDREAVMTNSAAYIQSWIEVLQNDKKLIFHAAAQAQKAVEYILGSEPIG